MMKQISHALTIILRRTSTQQANTAAPVKAIQGIKGVKEGGGCFK
jgi:hypothetical protein